MLVAEILTERSATTNEKEIAHMATKNKVANPLRKLAEFRGVRPNISDFYCALSHQCSSHSLPSGETEARTKTRIEAI
jgi:hypothetical protein